MIHSMPSFTAVGDALLDLVLSRGLSSHSARIRVRAGGTAANASVWAAAAGATARCVGRVGDDAAALALRAALDSRGVEAKLVTDPSRPTGAVAVLDGELAVDRGASAALEPADLAGLLEADALLVSGYLLFHDDSAATGIAALAGARADWLAVDAGVRRLEPSSLGRAAKANALFLDEPAAQRVTGGTPEEATRLLGERFRLVCVTRGTAGAIGSLDGTLARAEPPTVHPGAAAGAGDAFAAGVLVALTEAAGLAEALAAGCALGAQAAASPDGWPPTR